MAVAASDESDALVHRFSVSCVTVFIDIASMHVPYRTSLLEYFQSLGVVLYVLVCGALLVSTPCKNAVRLETDSRSPKG